jgi:hypothetical protein
VLQVGSVDGEPYVRVAYGTSQKTDRLHAGEFLVSSQDGAAYAVSGLAYPTKFDLRRAIELPYTDTWFGVPPRAPFGQTPKLGLLHPALMRRAKAAFMAAKRG